jgi:hypothetical protein
VPFIVAGLLGGAVALLRGGRLSNLTKLSLRLSALPLLALGLQIYVIYGPARVEARPFSFPALLILASYGLLLVAVLTNRQLPGMAWLGLGVALNFAVILVNGGWMPVTAELLATAGFVDTPSAIAPGERVLFTKDVVMVGQEIHLRWLSDLLVIPKAGLFSAVFSLGDALMMVGLFRLIQAGMMHQVEGSLHSTEHVVRH